MTVYQERRRLSQVHSRVRVHATNNGHNGQGRRQQILLCIGAICALLGPLLLAASFVPQGDLPAHDATVLSKASATNYIAHHPVWLVSHTGRLAAGLLWVVVLAALAGTLPPGVAGLFARWIVPNAIVIGSVLIFEYGVDGYALWALANEWVAAPEPEKPHFLMMVDTARLVLNGALHSELIISYSLTVIFAGLAVVLDGRYPLWFGTIGMVSGAAGLASGLLAYAEVHQGRADPLFFITILPISSLWLLGLGILMWRRAHRLRENEAT